MSVATDEIFDNMLKQSNARPLTQADIERLGLVPFTFCGGPADGDVLYDGEEFTRRCHEAAGREFDRTDLTGHGPSAVTACGAVHRYRTDWDRQSYIYNGCEGFLVNAGGQP